LESRRNGLRDEKELFQKQSFLSKAEVKLVKKKPTKESNQKPTKKVIGIVYKNGQKYPKKRIRSFYNKGVNLL
jgi:hypothetical protein